MKTTLKDLMQKLLEWNPYLGVWIDAQGNIYELKDKDITDTIEFEMIDGSEYELAAALHSLTDDKHGS